MRQYRNGYELVRCRNSILALAHARSHNHSVGADGSPIAVTGVPNLPASKTTSGAFGVDRIPSLNASKINAGILGDARIPNLDTSKITSGQFGLPRMPRGTDGHVLTGTGAGSDPAYEAPAAGVWDLIATLNPAGASSVDTGTITAHDMWMVVIDIVITYGSARWVQMRINNDSGNDYDSRGIDSTTIVEVSNASYMKLGASKTGYPFTGVIYISGRRVGSKIGVAMNVTSLPFSDVSGTHGVYHGAGADVTRLKFLSEGSPMAGIFKVYAMDF